MAIRNVLSAVKKLRRFIPGKTRDAFKKARAATQKERTDRFAKGSARVEALKSRKKIARARNIASIRRKRLRGEKFNAIKERIPAVARKIALPTAGVVGGATAGFVIGRRKQRRTKATTSRR